MTKTYRFEVWNTIDRVKIKYTAITDISPNGEVSIESIHDIKGRDNAKIMKRKLKQFYAVGRCIDHNGQYIDSLCWPK